MDKPIRPHLIEGTFNVPGDKSISHRAVMLGSLAEGTTKISNFLHAEDCLSTLACFNALGVQNQWQTDDLYIHGLGLNGLTEPKDVLNAGNSGTTIRLMSGILAAQPFLSVVTGDDSLRSRPMKRVIEPLWKMGAQIFSREGGYAPLVIKGGKLRGYDFTLPVASAQLKSALLLAGLYAEGKTTIVEPSLSRDHSERMLKFFGATLSVAGNQVSIEPATRLEAKEIAVPGDISSAAFLIVAGLIAGRDKITISSVGVNPTRTGILDVLAEMGAKIICTNQREQAGEPVADIEVYPSDLKGTEISGDIIPRLIDEIPILAVAAAFAEGDTIIRDAQELRIKESDRLKAIAEELTKFGAIVIEYPDGLKIKGGVNLQGAVVDPRHDHRIAMAMAVAGLAAIGDTTITNAECVNISFPGFFELVGENK